MFVSNLKTSKYVPDSDQADIVAERILCEALNEGSILMMYVHVRAYVGMYVSITIRIDMHAHSWAGCVGDAYTWREAHYACVFLLLVIAWTLLV